MRTETRKGFQGPDRIVSARNSGESAVGLMDFILANPFAADGRSLPRRSDVKSLLKYGCVRLDGNVVSQFNAAVEPGALVEVNHTRPFVVFSHPRMKLVYEDDDIIVVNKGYGLLSVGTGSMRKEPTAYDILKDYVKRQHPANKIFVVHRLDRDTSGLMMFAKTPEAQAAMQTNWKNMVLRRTYVALVEGSVADDEGEIRSNLDETSRYEVYSTREEGQGKPAVTRYRVLERSGGYTLMEFSLQTGRKNQIRVHSRDLGHPIVGDRKYGAKRSPIGRLALHARTLRFAHPVTRRDMNFELPIPSKFIGLLRHS